MKEIEPQPTGSGAQLMRHTEPTQQMTQVVQVITHENKKNGVAVT